MHLVRTLVAVLLTATAMIVFAASNATAIPIHVHHTQQVNHSRVIGYDPDGPIVKHWTTTRDVVTVENVAPPPAPVAAPVTTSSVAQATTTTATSSSVSSASSGYAIPSSIVQCESGGNPTAVNSSSGAGGLYQILPSTWAQYGGTGAPQDASVAQQSAIAARIYADVGASAWSCAG